MKRLWTILIWVAVLSGAFGLLLWWIRVEPAPPPLQGEVEMVRVNLASKVPGRLKEVYVTEGQRVEKGERLVAMEGPELLARLEQAQSAQQAALAQLQKAETGARLQEIQSVAAQADKASAARILAETTLERMQRLFEQGVIPRQRLDEAQTQYAAMLATEQMASAQLDLAMEGARPEDLDMAAAQLRRAVGSVTEVESFLAETSIHAPFDGEVEDIILRSGELAGSGTPLVVLLDPSDVWVVFQIPEDRLSALQIGQKLSVDIPALDARNVTLTISRIAVLPHFATWRATRASRGFDVRTFEVRARFDEPEALPGLRPGMSVLFRPGAAN